MFILISAMFYSTDTLVPSIIFERILLLHHTRCQQMIHSKLSYYAMHVFYLWTFFQKFAGLYLEAGTRNKETKLDLDLKQKGWSQTLNF